MSNAQSRKGAHATVSDALASKATDGGEQGGRLAQRARRRRGNAHLCGVCVGLGAGGTGLRVNQSGAPAEHVDHRIVSCVSDCIGFG